MSADMVTDNRPRTPWFSAREQPPVNGEDCALYEWMCLSLEPQPIELWLANEIRNRNYVCPHCRWRGLARREDSDATA